jgi:glucose-6-phosphate 1-dehydrogenase
MSDVRPADPCVMVVFGGAGDLTKRKLVPSLYNLRRNGLIGEQFAIIGCAMNSMSDEEFRVHLDQAMKDFGLGEFDPAVWQAMREHCGYVTGTFDDPATFERLKEKIAQVDQDAGTRGNALYYCAIPPQFFGVVAQQLGAGGLVKDVQGDDGWTRIVIEKPFGRDLASAAALNQELLSCFDERQVYRIDHYLGKETVQNILSFRFANGIFEPIWNRRYIDHVQLTVAEELGVEGRGGYYEGAGALRDILQNHMFQVLCLVAMEPPISFDADDILDEKVKVLHSLNPPEPEEVLHVTARGQYGPGAVEGEKVPGYRQEPSVKPDSTTETFAAVKLFVENWRWAGVPFYLRTGKRLHERETEVVIEFRRAPLLLVRGMGPEQVRPNRLTIHIQPDERITLRFEAKRPGPGIRLVPVEMEFRYQDLEGDNPATGYETLLYDVMNGDRTLFHRADMVEAAWKVVTPIMDVWSALPPRDFPNYEAGSWGPKSADELMTRDGREWVTPES